MQNLDKTNGEPVMSSPWSFLNSAFCILNSEFCHLCRSQAGRIPPLTAISFPRRLFPFARIQMAATTAPSVDQLEAIARTLRTHALRAIAAANSGHPGGSLSAAEVVTALYFGGILEHDPKNPEWPDRDRFILSKGHGVPILYAALAERGYFPVEEVMTLRQVNSRMQGHPVQGMTPGIEASTGSLGQGLSIGIGHAIAGRLDGKHFRTYVLLGDGECQEGQVWEAAMCAGNYELDTLCAIVDYNRYQLDGAVEDIQSLEPMHEKFVSFKWRSEERRVGKECR